MRLSSENGRVDFSYRTEDIKAGCVRLDASNEYYVGIQTIIYVFST
jgi:hypothetical protein